jgi:hypothetical protein
VIFVEKSWKSSGNRSRAAGSGCGSLTTDSRKPAAVKASVIACRGRRQKVIGKDRPPNVHSSVQLVVAW